MKTCTIIIFLVLFTVFSFFTFQSLGQTVRNEVRAEHYNELPPNVKLVNDPYGKGKKPTAEQIKRINSSQWSNQKKEGDDAIDFAVLNFRVNSPILEHDYMDNARAMDMIHEVFTDKDLITYMEFITIMSASSPEGNLDFNDKLAQGRAAAVKSYLMWKYPYLDRDKIFAFSMAENWIGLQEMVEKDLDTPNRAEVLELLNLNIGSDEKELRLKQLHGGTTYRYIAANMLPKLRGAATCMIYYKEGMEPTVIHESRVDTVYFERIVEKTVEVPVEIPVEVIVEVEKETQIRDVIHYITVKNNLLYDAALLPNLAMEFYLGNRWSVEVEGQWAWWNTKTTHNFCWRIQTAGVEARKWLNKSPNPLSGHYLGLYGMAGTYDVKYRDKDGYLSNMSYSMGMSYGYALPVARRLNLEFGFAMGYMGGKYSVYDQYNAEYDVFPRKEWRERRYFGPTKAKISLVWFISNGVNNTKKR